MPPQKKTQLLPCVGGMFARNKRLTPSHLGSSGGKPGDHHGFCEGQTVLDLSITAQKLKKKVILVAIIH